MQVTAGNVLSQVQKLIGEPAGGYYDMRHRLQQVSLAQREMVQDALGSVRSLEIEVAGEDIYLPDDFSGVGKENPYFVSPQGTSSKLRVVNPSWMDAYVADWQDGGRKGSPQYLITDGSRRVRLWPKGAAGTLVITYVDAPDDVRDEDDLIFDGDPMLARFSQGLAYKVAANELMGINPDLGGRYLSYYRQELGRMREVRRTSPGRYQKARPAIRRGRI